MAWLDEAIANETLVAVTQGSYMKEIDPHINSEASVFEYSRGLGCLGPVQRYG